MGAFEDLFIDQMFDIPRDADIKNDIRTLQRINGIIKPPSLRTQDTKNKKFFRHADAAIALAMLSYASNNIDDSVSYKAMRLKWL